MMRTGSGHLFQERLCFFFFFFFLARKGQTELCMYSITTAWLFIRRVWVINGSNCSPDLYSVVHIDTHFFISTCLGTFFYFEHRHLLYSIKKKEHCVFMSIINALPPAVIYYKNKSSNGTERSGRGRQTGKGKSNQTGETDKVKTRKQTTRI